MGLVAYILYLALIKDLHSRYTKNIIRTKLVLLDTASQPDLIATLE